MIDRAPPWVAGVAVAILMAVGIGTFTLIRHQQSASAVAAAPVATLSGLTLGIDLDAKGSGWVVTEGNIRKPLAAYWTADGGQTWHRALELETGSVGYLRSFGPSTAVLSYFPMAPGFKQGLDAAHGVLYVTTDGGRHWTASPLPGTALQTDMNCCGIPTGQAGMEFATVEEGYFYGLPTQARGSALYRTTDAGRSWKQLSAPSVNPPRWVFAADRLTGIAPVAGVPSPANPPPPPVLLVTADGGKSATEVSLPALPLDSGYPGLGAGVVASRWTSPKGASLFVQIGLGGQGIGSPERLYVYATTDGGRDWSAPALAWSGKAVDGIPVPAVLGPDRWIVAAGTHVTLPTGLVQLPIAPPVTVSQVDFPDATHGFLATITIGGPCGSDCRPTIIKTSDGGRTWSLLTGPSSAQAPSPPTAIPQATPKQAQSLSISPTQGPVGTQVVLEGTGCTVVGATQIVAFENLGYRPGTYGAVQLPSIAVDGAGHWQTTFTIPSQMQTLQGRGGGATSPGQYTFDTFPPTCSGVFTVTAP